MSNKKHYFLLYLPAGKLIEIYAPSPKNRNSPMEYRVICKTRADIHTILNRILVGGFHPEFYTHNELLSPQNLKRCHFSFQRKVKDEET